jgi:hypothetical protein
MEEVERLSNGTMTAKEALQTQGRASIETLCWGGKYARMHIGAGDWREKRHPMSGAEFIVRHPPDASLESSHDQHGRGERECKPHRVAALVPWFNVQTAIANFLGYLQQSAPGEACR